LFLQQYLFFLLFFLLQARQLMHKIPDATMISQIAVMAGSVIEVVGVLVHANADIPLGIAAGRVPNANV
jgi:hypothetical protein